MKKISLFFLLTILCISTTSSLAIQTQQIQDINVQATQSAQPVVDPSISMTGNTMIISGNGYALNSVDLDTIISTNNAQGVDTTIVSAPGTIIENYDFVNTTVSIDSSDNVVIRNNNFMNHYSNGTFKSRYIVQVTFSNNVTIENNVFNNITSIYTNGFDLMGIYLESDQGVTVHNNTFSNFSAQGMYTTAIYGFGVSSVSVVNNIIMDNTASRGIDGIWLEEASSDYVANNTINNLLTTSGKAKALEVYAGMNNVFDENQISNIYANQSQAYGYYFGQTNQIKIVQTVAYHVMLSGFTANLSGTTYADIQLWQTNHTQISTLHNMNATVADSGSFDYFNYTKNGILQVEGIWNNNMTTFDIAPSSITDQYQLLFSSISPSIYVLNSTAFTENVAPVILTSTIQGNATSMLENESILFSWSLSDGYPGDYTIYANETSVATGSWKNNVLINYNFSGFAVGSYNLTAVFSDMFGNSVTYNVMITVNAIVTSTSSSSNPTSSSSTASSTTTTNTTSSTSNTTGSGDTSSSAGGFLPINLMAMILSIATIGIIRKQKN